MNRFTILSILFLSIITFSPSAENFDIESVWINAAGNGDIEFAINKELLSGIIAGSSTAQSRMRMDEKITQCPALVSVMTTNQSQC